MQNLGPHGPERRVMNPAQASYAESSQDSKKKLISSLISQDRHSLQKSSELDLPHIHDPLECICTG